MDKVLSVKLQKSRFQSPLYRVNVEIGKLVRSAEEAVSFNPLYIGSMLKSSKSWVHKYPKLVSIPFISGQC